MTPPQFPFAALVGLDTLRLALQLAAVDRRLGVLLRGDRGAGKTTAARGMAALLGSEARFMTLPIGATEDRLLGGLDVEKALTGEPALKPGLLAEANGGVLYIDEVNLLPDHLADALLDASAGGVHIVEREGFSMTQPADFVLLGSMNPEEGALRPQLLDRFALAVDVDAPIEVEIRSEVLARRLAFDGDPDAFCGAWADAQRTLAARVAAARASVSTIAMPREMLHYAAERVAAHDVRSLRADLALVRAARAHAALGGVEVVMPAHVDAVLALVLAHRVSRGPRPPSTPPPPMPPASENGGSRADGGGAAERVFDTVALRAPRLVVEHRRAGGEGAAPAVGKAAGPVVATRRSDTPREVDLRSSLLHAVTHTGKASLRVDDLHARVRAPRAARRFIFVVDASGSHAVRERMRLVKGAVAGLLEGSRGRHDEVVVIGCRGAAARVVVEPTPSCDEATAALDCLPTGGRTPLAHALELAAGYVTDNAVMVIVTDGRANVPSQGADAWQDAMAAAAALRCAALVIDSEDAARATGRPGLLAATMGATCVRLDDLSHTDAVQVIQEMA